MTTEQRQFFAACVAAALFLAAVLASVDMQVQATPLADRPALAPRSAHELIALLLARAANMDGSYTAKEITGIIAGAVTLLVIVGWTVFLAIGYMLAR
jgi:hypothetical protein